MSPGERTSRVIVATEGSMAAKEALERGGDPSTTERAPDRLLLVGMIRNGPLMVARGCLAVLFGVSVLGWPGVTLATTVMLFGAYAVLDGMLALAAATRGPLRLFQAWPVALEGLVSIVLGGVALAAPLRVPRDFLLAIVAWGLVIGILEIVEAVRVPRPRGVRWLLATGGASSLFLASLLLMLPYAGADRIVHVLGAYGLVFGTTMALAAFAVSLGARPARPLMSLR